MPSIYTHAVFANKVKNELSKELKEIIEKKNDFYIMFSQSFDNLYYYNFLSFNSGKKIRNLGKYAHTHKTNEYFKNLITYIKEKRLENKPEVLMYLFGAINHYISDSMLHPYISYRTGRYSKKRKQETRKYLGKHTAAEIQLDAYYYELIEKKSYKKYKIYKEFIKKLCFSKELIKTINHTFKQTFDVDNMGIIFNKSYNQSKYVYKFLMYDPFGIKNFIYKAIYSLIPNLDMKISSFSLFKEPVEERFFNRKNNAWCNPADMDMLSEESWDELFKKTVKRSAKTIKQAYMVLNNKMSIEKFLKNLGNNSYTTGLDLSDKRITKYYEY